MSISPMAPEGIDEVLATLPDHVATGWRDGARLVVSPSGAFVLVADEDDIAAAAERSHDLAESTRRALARHLSWVPFIDAAVVSARGTDRDLQAMVVAPDLLAQLMVQGPPVIDGPAITMVRDLLATGGLHGWMAAADRDGDKIDLCSSTSPTPVTATS